MIVLAQPSPQYAHTLVWRAAPTRAPPPRRGVAAEKTRTPAAPPRAEHREARLREKRIRRLPQRLPPRPKGCPAAPGCPAFSETDAGGRACIMKTMVPQNRTQCTSISPELAPVAAEIIAVICSWSSAESVMVLRFVGTAGEPI